MQAVLRLSYHAAVGRPEVRCCSQPRNGKSVLDKVHWDCGLVATTMTSYLCGFHYPLSYSGLSIVSSVLHDEVFDVDKKAFYLLMLQSAELCGTIWLIRSSTKQFGTARCLDLRPVFNRPVGWALILIVTLSGVLLAAAKPALWGLLSSYTPEADLKEMLGGSSVAVCSTVVVFSGITPLLEEFVYRGFLLTSLASYTRLPLAVILSSVIFTLAHMDYLHSPPATLLIFIIGCILGTSYATSRGDIAVPLTIHSLYNLFIVTYTFMS